MIDHPQRIALHNEIHARPPEPMTPPLAITHVVMLADAGAREASREHVSLLLRDHHLPALDAQTTHSRHNLGGYRLRWERHTEFVSWSFMRPLAGDIASVDAATVEIPPTAIAAVPVSWLDGLPGERLVALHLWVWPAMSEGERDTRVRQWLHDDTLVGALVAEGRGHAYTDFAIHADGYSRVLVFADDLTPRALGRLIQRLLEIETYRLAALLGLPAAHAAAGELAHAERDLAALATAIRSAPRDAEHALLDRLTNLAGQIEPQ